MKILLAGLALFGAAAIAGVAQPRLAHSAAPAPTAPAAKTISVTGNGSIETVPDRATFSFTVTTQADTAKAALAKNGSAADAVAAALKGAKVQTSDVMLQPQMNDAGTAVLGYTASTTVTAETELAKAGPLVDAAVDAGATGVSGPSWSRSDYDALYRQALQYAVADAKAKAQALADSGGLTLGSITAMSEGGGVVQPLPYAAAASDGVAKLEPGTQTVDASVSVTFAALDR
jgi:uncharacterized protein YggE